MQKRYGDLLKPSVFGSRFCDPFLIRLSLILLLFILFLTGCAGEPVEKTVDPGTAASGETGVLWQIVDYRNRAGGGEIPGWVSAYLAGGNAAVEAFEEFQDYYVFISMNSGTNSNALLQWQEGFSPEMDVARLVAVRIENRFLSAGSGNPDRDYGSYFEALIRAASDMSWEWVLREGDFWIYRRFPESEDAPMGREVYDFFVLTIIEKSLLVSRLNALMQGIKPVTSLSRDQAAAVNRVQDRFFDSF